MKSIVGSNAAAPVVDTETSFRTTLSAAQRAGLRVDDTDPPTIEVIEGEELDLHYVDWRGDADRTIVFLHGFLQQSRTWDFTCLALRSRFRCISLDIRGHGDSGRPAAPDYSTHHYLRDLGRLLDHLKRDCGIPRVSLCGLSLGGQLSYLYASKHPEDVESLVIVDVAPELNREARRGVSRYISALPRDGTFDSLLERVAELSPMRTRDQIRSSLLRAVNVDDDGGWRWKHDPRLLDHHRASFTSEQLWDALSAVKAPTLFVLGRNSKMVSSETVRRMVETVPGSSASFVPKASHRVPGDNPSGFLAAVEPFFMRHLISEPREAKPR